MNSLVQVGSVFLVSYSVMEGEIAWMVLMKMTVQVEYKNYLFIYFEH